MDILNEWFLHIKKITAKISDKYNKIDLKIRKIVNIALGSMAIAILLNMNFSLGYDVVLNNQIVGNSFSKKEVEGIISQLNEKYAPYYNGLDVVDTDPLYSLKLIKKDNVTSNDEILENIKKSTGRMVKQFVISVDGNDLAGLRTKKDADEALEICKNKYIEENTKGCEIKSDVKIEEKYAPSTLLTSVNIAVNNLCDNDYFDSIKILTYEIEEYDNEIAFDVERIKSDEVYEGNKRVSVKGENGIEHFVNRIDKINGEVEEEKIVSKEVTKKPKNQVLLVGTKERPAGVGTGSFMMPYGGNITSRYGQRGSRLHKGIDIVGPTGSKIYAADEGIVTYADYEEGGYGNIVKINHNNGYETFYAHCNEIFVSSGDAVKKGDVIATVGNTGRSTGSHLHFEIRENGAPVNPLSCIE